MGKRLMIVDDSRVIMMQMKKLLEDTEYEIAAFCQSGEDAIARYGEVQPDLVTMDIIMPGMDGIETARAILEEHPDAKLVMVSSLAFDDTIQESEELGAKGFVYKPFDKEHLVDAIEKALAKS